jgi:hypothetical protein
MEDQPVIQEMTYTRLTIQEHGVTGYRLTIKTKAGKGKESKVIHAWQEPGKDVKIEAL